MATSVKESENAVESLVNILYLIETDVSSSEQVVNYVKVTDRPMTSLLRLVDEIRAVA